LIWLFELFDYLKYHKDCVLAKELVRKNEVVQGVYPLHATFLKRRKECIM